MWGLLQNPARSTGVATGHWPEWEREGDTDDGMNARGSGSTRGAIGNRARQQQQQQQRQ